MIGVNVSGSEYSWETYPIVSHLNYLKNKGITLIRLPIAWEKVRFTKDELMTDTEADKIFNQYAKVGLED
jgi:aryl-phospho-beta-D-glucosidase BglC (GH1 family)